MPPSSSPSPDSPPPPRVLSPTDLRMVENWVQLADSIGLPKSHAQIYGLIFISRDPVSAQDCVDLLRISRSSAGQGLRALRDVGAIRPALELGARREAFVIEPDLGVVVKGVLRGRLLPSFEQFFQRVEQVEQDLPANTPTFAAGRIRKLRRWRSKLNSATRWFVR